MGIVLKNELLVSVNHREDRNESISYLNRLKLVIAVHKGHLREIPKPFPHCRYKAKKKTGKRKGGQEREALPSEGKNTCIVLY